MEQDPKQGGLGKKGIQLGHLDLLLALKPSLSCVLLGKSPLLNFLTCKMGVSGEIGVSSHRVTIYQVLGFNESNPTAILPRFYY